MTPIEEIERKSLSDSDIKKVLGRNCKIIKYSQLSKYSDLEQLLPKNIDFVVVLIENSPNVGHWCALLKYNNIFEWFDSYGFKVDQDLGWTPMQKRKQLNEDVLYLSKLLNKSSRECIYNNIKYQEMSNQINTCGTHVCCRIWHLMKKNLSLPQYYKMMKTIHDRTGYTYDEVASMWINPFL